MREKRSDLWYLDQVRTSKMPFTIFIRKRKHSAKAKSGGSIKVRSLLSRMDRFGRVAA